MQTTRILKEFHISNLGRESNIRKICSMLNLTECDVTLDIRECNIDYPATSKLLDTILELLAQMDNRKQFIILYDINFDEIILLQYFVVGSSFLDISNKCNDVEEYRQLINVILEEKKISLIIKIQEGDKEIKNYSYGFVRLEEINSI